MGNSEVRDPASTTPEEIVKRGVFKTGMKFFTVWADAEMARDLLQYNRAPQRGVVGTNRKASKVKIVEYRDKMLTEQWELNPQPIIFSEKDGFGVIEQEDGQQRLMGLVEADKIRPGIVVPLTVCVEAPLQAKMVLDQGKPRLLKDWLTMADKRFPTQLSYAAKMLYAIETYQPFTSVAVWRGAKLTPASQEEFLRKHPQLEQGLEVAAGSRTLVMHYVGAVLWYMMQQEYGLWKTAEFMTGLEKGANLDFEDPRLKVRAYLSKKKLEKYPWDGFEQLGVLIASVNAWLIKSERFKAGGAFSLTSKKFPVLIPRAELPEELFILEPGQEAAS